MEETSTTDPLLLSTFLIDHSISMYIIVIPGLRSIMKHSSVSYLRCDNISCLACCPLRRRDSQCEVIAFRKISQRSRPTLYVGVWMYEWHQMHGYPILDHPNHLSLRVKMPGRVRSTTSCRVRSTTSGGLRSTTADATESGGTSVSAQVQQQLDTSLESILAKRCQENETKVKLLDWF
jgi:hypothetical protein